MYWKKSKKKKEKSKKKKEKVKEKEGKNKKRRRKNSKKNHKPSFAIRGWPLVLTEKDQPIFGAGEMYYTSQYFICWDFGGMTIQELNIGGIHPNCLHPKPRPTTPQDFFYSIGLKYRKEKCYFIYKISAEIFLTMIKVKVRQDYDGMKNQESRSQNEWDLCQ